MPPRSVAADRLDGGAQPEQKMSRETMTSPVLSCSLLQRGRRGVALRRLDVVAGQVGALEDVAGGAPGESRRRCR